MQLARKSAAGFARKSLVNLVVVDPDQSANRKVVRTNNVPSWLDSAALWFKICPDNLDVRIRTECVP